MKSLINKKTKKENVATGFASRFVRSRSASTLEAATGSESKRDYNLVKPQFTTKLYGKQNKAGRQRGKDRTDSTDGVRQLFELWWSKASRGVTFQLFYQNHLSKSMRFYYPREYIHGANTKSAAEYRQWRKEWAAKHAVKTA